MEKRITIICGHYGSGKTEVSLNYAVHIASKRKKAALVDLDIVNPYFRSREYGLVLAEKGVDVYSDAFGYDITADLPALTANVRKPLEDKDTFTVVDAGGDAAGARALNQFRRCFPREETEVVFVINAKRPETSTIDGAKAHIAGIRAETGLSITGIINNTHLLRETTVEIVKNGMVFAENLAEEMGVAVKFHTCREDLHPQVLAWMDGEGSRLNLAPKGTPKEARKGDPKLFPLVLYMRPTWLDK